MEKFINKGTYFEYDLNNDIQIIFTNTDANDLAFQGENKDHDVILNNRKRLASAMNTKLSNFTFARQNHTENIYQVASDDKGKGSLNFDDGINNVDGLYTFENQIVLSTFHADCTPVYIYSEEDNFISVLHAGLQGTLKSITYKALKYYINELQINSENLKVVIGPCISIESFEVESDVLSKLKELTYIDYNSCFETVNAVKYKVDIKRVNKLQAIEAGIREDNIYVSTLNTHSNADFYSFRDKKSKERMIACIVQNKGEK